MKPIYQTDAWTDVRLLAATVGFIIGWVIGTPIT